MLKVDENGILPIEDTIYVGFQYIGLKIKLFGKTMEVFNLSVRYESCLLLGITATQTQWGL